MSEERKVADKQEKLSLRQRQGRDAEQAAADADEVGEATDVVVPGPSQWVGEADGEPVPPHEVVVRRSPSVLAAEQARDATAKE